MTIRCFVAFAALLAAAAFAHALGAGFCLDFDGGSEYGETEANEIGDSFTLEAWIRSTDSSPGSSFTEGAPLMLADVPGPAHDFGTSILNGRFAFGVGNGVAGGDQTIVSTTTVNTGEWLHVAAVRDGATGIIRVYVNGIEEASLSTGDTSNLGDAPSIAVARNAGTGRYWVGAIDELRIWNVARSEGEIRTNMCRRLVGTEPGLRSYYRFDFRRLGKSYDSSPPLNNLLTYNLEAGDWEWSGAFIGDETVTAYPPTTSMSISHSDGDQLTISGITGSPAAVHLLRMDGPTNQQIPPGGYGAVDPLRHWGVFFVGGSSPSVDLVLSYAGYPELADENLLGLTSRTDNADEAWIDTGASLDTGADTLSLSGQTGHRLYAMTTVDTFDPITTGSGRALVFDGRNQYAVVNRDVADSFTLEAWIRTGESAPGGSTSRFNAGLPVIYADVINYHHDFGTSIVNDRFAFGVGNGLPPASGGDKTIQSTTVVTTYEWVHVAAVRDGSSGMIRLMVNGVEEASLDTGDTTPLNDPPNIKIGANTIDHRYFAGMMDEVRIWNVARTEAQVQATMCKRLNGSEPGLVGLWRLDGSSATTAFDSSPSANHATFYNMTAPNRLWSGAPLGEANLSAYPPTAAMLLSHPDGDGIQVDNFGGAPVGLHVYRVDGPPNLQAPSPDFTAIDQARHWGVWAVGDSGATYDVTLSYAGHPGIVSEDLLGIDARWDNATAAWWNGAAVLDTAADTLTLTGESGRSQYILATNGGGVPVVLQRFTVD